MTPCTTPGVYREDVAPAPPPRLSTGVPVFLGYAGAGPLEAPAAVRQWSQYGAVFGSPGPGSYLGWSVRGFFDNEGSHCYVVRLDESKAPKDALGAGLLATEPLDRVDLVCTPDLMRHREAVLELQAMVLEHCGSTRNRFAILDTPPGGTLADAVRHWQELAGVNGALYYPWVRVQERTGSSGLLAPPAGHVAGVYSRTDRQSGVFKSPANAEVQGITDVEFRVAAEDQETQDPNGAVNCLRPFAGRGIRVWGARTISGQPDWKYVAVRRLYLTIARWFEIHMPGLVLEPNDAALWARIRREANEFLAGLFRAGAFQGRKPEEAYFVKCGEATSTAEMRDAGAVGVEVAFAPATPNEFVIVRFVHGAPQQE